MLDACIVRLIKETSFSQYLHSYQLLLEAESCEGSGFLLMYAAYRLSVSALLGRMLIERVGVWHSAAAICIALSCA
jgi:hypothetical protein